MSDTITDPIGYDRLAFALVVALHNEETEAAALMLHDMEPADMASLCVVLALSLDQAWIEQCEMEGVSFDEFVKVSGLWLAGGDV